MMSGEGVSACREKGTGPAGRAVARGAVGAAARRAPRAPEAQLEEIPDPEVVSPQPLPAGTLAPEFRLLSADAAAVPPGKRPVPEHWRTLRDQAGSPVVLVFYPADFTPVCGDELALYNELLSEFDAHRAKVLGISVDSVWCH